MMRLVLSYVTFPGIVAHEFAHAWACRRCGVPVQRVCYLRFGNPMGYVLHERPDSPLQHIMIAVAPFVFCTVTALALGCALCGILYLRLFPEFQDFTIPASIWLSFSIAYHAFPSSCDGDALWEEVKSPDVSFLMKLVLVPAVGLIRAAKAGASVWLDAAYAALVAAAPVVCLMGFVS